MHRRPLVSPGLEIALRFHLLLGHVVISGSLRGLPLVLDAEPPYQERDCRDSNYSSDDSTNDDSSIGSTAGGGIV